MNRKLALFGIVLFVSLFISISLPIVAEARTADNVYGWAWSSNIGWIKFNNCSNPRVPSSCNGPDFGVNKNLNNTLTGYAWSSNIGWIRFGLPADSTGRLLGGVPAGGAINYNAKIIGVSDLAGQHTYQLSGWARACSVFLNGCEGNLKPNEQRGGWDGWISLQGSYPNYQVTKISASDELDVLSGFTWGSTVLGWIKFDPLTATLMAQADTNCPGVCIVPAPPSTATLSVVKIGTGASVSSISSSDGGISCGASCSKTYTLPHSSVSLTAIPGANVTFNGWLNESNVNTCTSNGGTVSSTGLVCTAIPITVAKTVSAKFTAGPIQSSTVTLDVSIVGNGMVYVNYVNTPPAGHSTLVGFVTSAGQQLSQRPRRLYIPRGEQLRLTANPDANNTFSTWDNIIPLANRRISPAYLTMDENKSVTATFVGTTPPPPPPVGETCTLTCYAETDGISGKSAGDRWCDHNYGPYTQSVPRNSIEVSIPSVYLTSGFDALLSASFTTNYNFFGSLITINANHIFNSDVPIHNNTAVVVGNSVWTQYNVSLADVRGWLSMPTSPQNGQYYQIIIKAVPTRADSTCSTQIIQIPYRHLYQTTGAKTI